MYDKRARVYQNKTIDISYQKVEDFFQSFWKPTRQKLIFQNAKDGEIF